jgi:hypothetical protein
MSYSDVYQLLCSYLSFIAFLLLVLFKFVLSF